jgi:hypothetical protein
MATSALDIRLPGQLKGISQGWVTITIAKGTLILTVPEFVQGLRRAKQQRRRAAFEARHAQKDEA